MLKPTQTPPNNAEQSSQWRPSWRFAWQIFMGYFIIVGVAAFIILQSFMEELRPGVRQSLEDALVNTANLLAELAVESMIKDEAVLPILAYEEKEKILKSQPLSESQFAEAIKRFSERALNAQIWFLQKSTPDLSVYITNKQGIVVYDSKHQSEGQDYSRWNDVYLTLRGEYGARSTTTDPHNPNSSEMYVAAPIMYQGELIGVLSVAKPTFTVMPFVQRAEDTLRWKSLILLAISLLIGLALAYALTHSIRKLEHFVHRIRQGYRDPVPNIRKGEFSRLASAIGDMRDELEGKAYVERYVQTLTHELKSPITSIKGAAEIIQDLSQASHQTSSSALKSDDIQAIHRFSENILQDTQRLEHLINQLLQLASLEKQHQLEQTALIDINTLLQEQDRQYKALLAQKHNHLQYNTAEHSQVVGDPNLLALAISNLLSNALRFSLANTPIIITTSIHSNTFTLCIENQGSFIPDFAKAKIFDRFYSLSTHNKPTKSSGLGLSIVKEIAELHNGHITLDNTSQGVKARLSLPSYVRDKKSAKPST